MSGMTGNDKQAMSIVNSDLALLIRRTQEARVKLAALEQEVLNTEHNVLQNHQSGQLIEANGQLVLSLLEAQSSVEQAAKALREVSLAAQLDVLTGLPNRRLLLGRLAHAIDQAKQGRVCLAVLFLDLNDFKLINDTLGHAVGNEMLKETALRLNSVVQEEDTVGRYAGDEFLILLSGAATRADVLGICDKIVTALGTPRLIGKHVLRLTTSIGISLYPEDGDAPHTLIDCADAAMYRAKRYGLGRAFHSDASPDKATSTPPISFSLKSPIAHYHIAQEEYERRHAQLREANQQLVLAAINAQQLQAAAEQAHGKQKAILAMVAHELRNPLTPLTMVAGMLVRSPSERLPSIQEIIERQVSQISRLIDDLLDVSRVETGKLRLDIQPTDMTEIIDHAVSVCRSAMDLRLQLFVVHMPGCPLMVNGDPIRLTQVLCNLLGNASKYTPDGGSIELNVSASANVLTMTFSENGIGISAEVLAFIFDPFVQDTHAVGFNGAGLGIGLTVVRELVEGHQGKVSVTSAGRGLGSKFVVTLPLIIESQ